MSGPTKFTLSQLLEAHSQGLNNKDIAEVLGCTPMPVTRWLNALNLKRNPSRRSPATTEVGARRLNLHQLGYKLTEIAKIEGVTHQAVRDMLARCGEGYCSTKDIHEARVERLRAYQAKGMTIREASEHLGVSYAETRKLARKHGIQLKRSTRHIPATQEIIDYYLEVKSTIKVGKKFGIPQPVAWKRLNRAGVILKKRRKKETVHV